MASTSLSRPSPPPLPRDQQREFEELQRAAQVPFSATNPSSPADKIEAELAVRLEPTRPEFDGDINPLTGEEGGPKREPVGKWGEDHGDWSFKGRVSDF